VLHENDIAARTVERPPSVDDVRVLESCHSHWIFESARGRFRRVPRGTRLDMPPQENEWTPYYRLELDASSGAFSVGLNADDTRVLRSWLHAEPCRQILQGLQRKTCPIKGRLRVRRHADPLNPELLLQLHSTKPSHPANVVRCQERVQPAAERRIAIGPRPDDDHFHAGSLHRVQQIEVQPLDRSRVPAALATISDRGGCSLLGDMTKATRRPSGETRTESTTPPVS